MAALFFMFSKIGLFSIGGGYAVIAVIQEQLVIKSGWISQQAFTDMIAISQMTPGPLAINISTFVGMQLSGIPGAVAATLGCVSAGVIISLLLGIFFRKLLFCFIRFKRPEGNLPGTDFLRGADHPSAYILWSFRSR